MLRRTLPGTADWRLRLLAILLLPLVLATCLYLEHPRASFAQAPANPAAAPAAAPAAPAGGANQPLLLKDKNLLRFYYDALGFKYTVIFLGISFAFVAILVMNILANRRDNICPMHLVEGFEALLVDKRYQEAYELAKNDESFLGKVLSVGMAKLAFGYPQAIEAMQEVGEEETMKLEHRLSYIALIGTVSPMVGLLGTVDGMVAAFTVIADSPTQPKPSELAQGICMALITTLIGLWLAIPAVTVYGIFRNRLQRLTLEVGILSEGLMSRVGKKP